MEQELATEAASGLEQKPQPALPALESWAENERMRHIPALGWMIEKLEGDLRRRIDGLAEPFYPLAAADPRRLPIEESLRAICHAVDRLADVARHSRGAAHPPNDIASRIPSSIANAVASLRSIDANAFGRRFPYHTGDRSKAECVYASFMAVIQQMHRALPLIRAIDPTVDERMNAGLVQLQEPLRREPMA